ncbi:MAG: amidohydrolase family protein [Chloroflexi bacterium]|nr:amidohydrolase family protein [Chloroflexota bacterium]
MPMPTMDFEAYLPSTAPPEEQARALAAILDNETAGGIEYAVIMPFPIHPDGRLVERPDNRALAEAVRHERRVLPCCQINPNFGAESVQELETAATEWGMRMLKLMPILYTCPLDSPRTFAMMDKARELGLIVNIHSGGHLCHPLEIGALARRYPETPIIMDHMGYRTWQREAHLAAQANPNLYLGTTVAAHEPSFVARSVQAVGADRVIFGSNMPLLYADLAAEAIRRHGFGREVEALILGGNLARLYGML